jgi:hypothetical protein
MPYGPAARVTDLTSHGSPLAPGPGSTNVLIGSMPAWRALMDFHACPIVKVLIPDVGGMIMLGSPTVLINSMMACRVMDMVVEIPGGPNPVVIGATNVCIGDAGVVPPSTGVPGAGGASAGGDGGSGTESSADSGSGAAAAGTAGSTSAQASAGSPAQTDGSKQPSKKIHWVKFRVIDEKSGLPISGIVLTIRLSGNRHIESTTDRQGLVAVSDLDDTTCSVTSSLKHATLDSTFNWVSTGTGSETLSNPASDVDPWDSDAPKKATVISRTGARVAKIQEYKVTKGDTLQKLAAKAKMTVAELITFNWSRSATAKSFLRDYVGCTKRDRITKEYILDSSDDPGIISIPAIWEETGLAVDQVHEIRVKPACDFRIMLRNQEQLAIPEVKYEATFADGSKRNGRLGRSGIVLIKDPPAGKVEVAYPDYEDIEVKSLAASMRKAIEEKNTNQILHILKQNDVLVKRVSETYSQYYNDLSTKGMAEDIYENVNPGPDLEAIGILLLRAKVNSRPAGYYIRSGDSDV